MGMYLGSIRLLMLMSSLLIESTESLSIPTISGFPDSKFTPMMMYPPPQPSTSFANAHMVWSTFAGSHSVLYSILAISTLLPKIRFEVLTGTGKESPQLYCER